MNITLDKKTPTEGIIKVSLKQTDYQPKVEEKVKDYARKANIKGFRQGKVPAGLIKKMYGKSIVVDEVNNTLSTALGEYIKENNIQLIGEPLPVEEKMKAIDWETQTDFEFEYEVGMVDEFNYDLGKGKVTAYKIELDKKGMEETLDNIKKQFGNVTNPEEAKEGDDFFGTFKQVDGEISNESLLKWDTIAKKEQKKFAGAKPGDSIEVDIDKLVTDHHDLMNLLDIGHDKAHDIKGKFHFTIKNINRTEAAELNQELYDKVFGKDTVKSEEEFKNKVKEVVEENYKRESDLLLNRDVRDVLIKNTKIDIPETFLKRWLLVANEGVTQEDVDREFDDYVRSLKWDLIRNKVAEDNDIKVENEEVRDRTKSMILSQLGGPGAADQLKDHMESFADNYLQAENGQNYMKVYNEVREEKILQLIREKISVSEKKVNLDEFKKAVEN